MLRNYARLSQRQHDLVIGYPWTQDERVVTRLPDGWTVGRLPAARDVRSAFGRFTLTAAASADGKEVSVTAHLTVDRHRVARADYPAFREFCAQVDAAVAEELIVRAPLLEVGGR